MRERQQSSGKFRSHKRLLYDKTAHWKCYLIIFCIFIVPILKCLLPKILWKKTTIFYDQFSNFLQISTMLQNFKFSETLPVKRRSFE